MFPADCALVDAFTVAREDEIDEINLMLKAAATPENISLLAQRLTVPNAPDLEFSTREHHAYLLNHYIEPRFANVPRLVHFHSNVMERGYKRGYHQGCDRYFSHIY